MVRAFSHGNEPQLEENDASDWEPNPGALLDENEPGETDTTTEIGGRIIKPIKRFRLDYDLVNKYGFKAAAIAKYVECWVSASARRNPQMTAYTYDSLAVISKRLGMTATTVLRQVRQMRAVIVTQKLKNRKNLLQYGFKDQAGYFKSRKRVKHVWCLKADTEQHGFPAAILLHNMRYWARQNRERSRLHEGRFWRWIVLEDLVKVYNGLLSYDQIQKSLRLLEKEGLLRKIDYYNRQGIFRDNRCWITLTDCSEISDFAPESHVRWDGLKLRDGTVFSPPPKWRPAPKERKTASQKWKTDFSKSTSYLSHSEGVPTIQESRLIPASVTDSTVAVAPCESAKKIVNTNLQCPQWVRPSASQPPSASSPTVGTEPTGFSTSSFFYFQVSSPDWCISIEEVKKCTSQWSYPEAEYELPEPEIKVLGQPHHNSPIPEFNSLDISPAIFETQSSPNKLIQGPRGGEDKSSRETSQTIRKYSIAVQQIIAGEIIAGRQAINKSMSSGQQDLWKFQVDQAEKEEMIDCHGKEYSQSRSGCRDCLWQKSCFELLPAEWRKKGGKPKEPKTKYEKEMVNENPHQLRETYQTCHQEVFGVPAPDALGQADEVFSSAQQLEMPSRVFMVVYMTLWTQTHPRQKFLSKYLTGEAAFGMVAQLCAAARSEFSSRDETSLACLLKRVSKGTVSWKHVPGLFESFLDSCEKIGKKDIRCDYELSVEDIELLIQAASGKSRRDEFDKLLAGLSLTLHEGRPARDWFLYRTPPKSLAQVTRWMLELRETSEDYEWHCAQGQAAVKAGLSQRW